MAREKGPFPLYSREYLDSKFVQQLGEKARFLISEHGVRNSHLTSIAPTGTISLFAGNVSSGIEPIFAHDYTRKVMQKDGSKVDQLVEDYAVKMYREQLPRWNSTT